MPKQNTDFHTLPLYNMDTACLETCILFSFLVLVLLGAAVIYQTARPEDPGLPLLNSSRATRRAKKRPRPVSHRSKPPQRSRPALNSEPSRHRSHAAPQTETVPRTTSYPAHLWNPRDRTQWHDPSLRDHPCRRSQGTWTFDGDEVRARVDRAHQNSEDLFEDSDDSDDSSRFD